ncbi:flagellar biosynthesis protein FlaG [Oceanisphaera avium]|uniref:Flagellar biosynthesis protein FlaG n=2 Tax=Oceanisphaera avium TaxID=1903694 RepID=A0A1Y0CWK7_9GAMM|nr:flagellar biosynthesis protein FlaG [Oceanisphaera avium]
MDTLPLPAKAPILASDMSAKQQQVAITQPIGSEATQTVQAVQALDKSGANNSTIHEQKAEQAKTLNGEQLEELAKQMDKFVGSFTHELKFRVDEDSGRNVVTVIDSKSGDTIRQIPTEELLDVIARLAEASSGLINVKA